MSDTVRLPLSILPHDGGYLRRHCPNCAGEFKVHREEDADAALGEDELGDREFFCALCHEPSEGPWLTEAQQQFVLEAVTAMAAHRIGEALKGAISNDGGGFITMEVTGGDAQIPDPPDEPHDMVAMRLPCHDLAMRSLKTGPEMSPVTCAA